MSLTSKVLEDADYKIEQLEERLKASEARCDDLYSENESLLGNLAGAQAQGETIDFENTQLHKHIERLCKENFELHLRIIDLNKSINRILTLKCPDCGHDNVICACGYKS